MKRKLWRLRLIYLCLFCLGTTGAFSGLHAQSYTNGDFVYVINPGNTNTATITAYNGTNAAVIIPGNVDGLSVTAIGESAFFFNSEVETSVVIPEGVTDIGGAAFQSCVNLTHVTLPESLVSIETSAFQYCNSLTAITIPDHVTSLGNLSFYGCTSLTSVTIPGNVYSVGDFAFSACVSLTNLTIANGVTQFGGLAGCYGLTNIFVPASVTYLGAPFTLCTSLAAITVDPQNAFYASTNGVLFDKTGRTLVAFPGGLGGNYTVPDGVTNIGSGAFELCLNLTGVAIPSGVRTIGAEAFYMCLNLSNVSIANGVKNIAFAAFASCTNLTHLTIPGSVTNLGIAAFSTCFNLPQIFFTGNAPTVDSSTFETTYQLIAYYLPGTAGWGSTLGGVPAVLWNPIIQTDDGGFGLTNGQFAFNVTGTTNIPIVIQTAASLTGSGWTPLPAVKLTNGIFHFSDPQGNPARFYRISSP